MCFLFVTVCMWTRMLRDTMLFCMIITFTLEKHGAWKIHCFVNEKWWSWKSFTNHFFFGGFQPFSFATASGELPRSFPQLIAFCRLLRNIIRGCVEGGRIWCHGSETKKHHPSHWTFTLTDWHRYIWKEFFFFKGVDPVRVHVKFEGCDFCIINDVLKPFRKPPESHLVPRTWRRFPIWPTYFSAKPKYLIYFPQRWEMIQFYRWVD